MKNSLIERHVHTSIEIVPLLSTLCIASARPQVHLHSQKDYNIYDEFKKSTKLYNP